MSQLLGYERLGDPKLAGAISELYREVWEPLHNFFLPSMKLVSKERHGAKIKRRHDAPRTPCERLLASTAISAKTKRQLRARRAALNPFELHQELEERLRPILHWALRSSRPTDSLHCAPNEGKLTETTVS